MAEEPHKKSAVLPLLFRAANRAVVFGAAWVLDMLLFFLLAQFRRFLDADMLSLARALSFVSIALLAALWFHLVLIILCTILTKNLKCLACLGIFAAALVIALAALGVSFSISYVSAGF
ncbi:MAG: hypothetical protein LBS97_03190 [Treponema sp.]|jgi:hypothetical protein|nr:hypothetical protein [Treponema sp.]